jgi:hypothetical protein
MTPYTPLTIRIPIKGTLLIRLDGSDTLHELGKVVYEADVDVQFSQSNITPTDFERNDQGGNHDQS